MSLHTVIPAKAGIQKDSGFDIWIPTRNGTPVSLLSLRENRRIFVACAFAGMTALCGRKLER